MDTGEGKNQLSTAERFAALSRVGTALMSELDETRLLHLIAETACELTGATFAAFTLRPTDEGGEPLVPSEGNLFRLAAVVGVSKEQEDLFRRMSLGGEGLLSPIFRYGVPVRVSDAITHIAKTHLKHHQTREAAHESAFSFAHGQLPSQELRSMGIPRGHPIVHSFLGAPLLDRDKHVRGGLLLGHELANQFSYEDELLLVGLAAQAAVALENARLYRSVQHHAQELDALFESIVDGVTLVDIHERVRRENRSARRLREILEKHSAGTQAMEALLHQPAMLALQGEIVQEALVTIWLGEQEIRDFSINASPLRQSTSLPEFPSSQKETNEQHPISGAVVVWHDVTESRSLLLERQIRTETEARLALLQLILDELPSSVYLVQGDDAQLVLANRASALVWGATWPHGQSMEQFLQEHNIRIFGIDGGVLPPEQLATLRAVRHGETVHHHQEVIRHADGTALPVLVNAVSLHLPQQHVSLAGVSAPLDGTKPLALVVHQDVTALKETERLKDEFIAIAAHELRSPLAVLKGFAQTLLVQTARGHGPALSEWQIEALQSIDQATTRLVELTEDLLDATRLQAGRMELHLEPTDLVALTRRLLARLQVTLQQHTLLLHTSLQHLVVSVDSHRMEQVLSNLISNAIKYSPEATSVEITVSELQEEQLALISICDHGIGIPVNQQARIFSRFVRADNAKSYGIGGTGLGLYLCRALIEQQHGRIWFESTEGQGSTFFVALPIIAHEKTPLETH